MKLSFRISSAKGIFLEKKKLLGLGFDLEQKKITETHTVFFFWVRRINIVKCSYYMKQSTDLIKFPIKIPMTGI